MAHSQLCANGYDEHALLAYLRDDRDAYDHDRLTQHLHSGKCDACTTLLRDLEYLHASLDTWRPLEIPSPPSSADNSLWLIPLARPALKWGFVASLLAVVTGIGGYNFFTQPSSDQSADEPVAQATPTAAAFGAGAAEDTLAAALDGVAADPGGSGEEVEAIPARWSGVEAAWRQVSTGRGADIGVAEDEHARVVTLWREMEELWRAGRESNLQPSGIFVQQVDEVLAAETGSGFGESCAQWQSVGGSMRAKEEDRVKLEARRRELEVMRSALEIERREWEVKRRENEVRRRELEVMRRGAEANRVALEARGAKDSEEYWRGIREYERVLFDDYARVFASVLKEEEEEYNNFMNGTYLTGQTRYVKGMAEVLAGYTALRWGCEADWGRQLF